MEYVDVDDINVIELGNPSGAVIQDKLTENHRQ